MLLNGDGVAGELVFTLRQRSHGLAQFAVADGAIGQVGVELGVISSPSLDELADFNVAVFVGGALVTYVRSVLAALEGAGPAADVAGVEAGVLNQRGSGAGIIVGGRIDTIVANGQNLVCASHVDSLLQGFLGSVYGLVVAAVVGCGVLLVVYVQFFIQDGNCQVVHGLLGKIERHVDELPVASKLLGVNGCIHAIGILSFGVRIPTPESVVVVLNHVTVRFIACHAANTVVAVVLLDDFKVAVRVGGIVDVHGIAVDAVTRNEEVAVGPAAVVALEAPALLGLIKVHGEGDGVLGHQNGGRFPGKE